MKRVLITGGAGFIAHHLNGDKMKQLGWVPAKSVRERITKVVKWTLENERWITNLS